MTSDKHINLQIKNFIFTFNGHMVKVGLGKAGITAEDKKREGDGKTPIGTYPLRQVYYRPDRVTLPPVMLEAIPITPDMGWCDDHHHPDYNRLIRLPFEGSHEKMWRDDNAYDVVIPLGYNDDPPHPGLGSAIFFHILHEGRDHTEGCVAIPADVMLDILPKLTPDTKMEIMASLD